MTIDQEFVVLNEGLLTECEARINVIEDISITIELSGFKDGENIPGILDFARKTFSDVIEESLKTFNRVRFDISADAVFESTGGDIIPDVTISNMPKFVYNHKHNREMEIRKQLLRIFDPQHYMEVYGNVNIEGDTSGSYYARTVYLNSITLNIITPLTYNPRALLTNMRLLPGLKFTRHLEFLPYNNDKYCFFHCLYYTLFDTPKVEQFRSLNNNKDYYKGFENFLEEYNIEEFYHNNLFRIDMIEEIEKRLDCSINIYRATTEGLDLYYRSDFLYSPKDPINILIVPLTFFNNTRALGVNKLPKICEPILQGGNIKEEKTTRISLFEYVNTVQAHAMVLNKSYFRKDSGDFVCRYCNVSKRSHNKTFEEHETNCLQMHQNKPIKERIRNYVEVKNPLKIFDKFASFYRIPFVTYDFETRIKTKVVNGKKINRHVPYSWALLYFNVFKPEKSIIKMKSSLNSKKLIEEFINECKNLTRYHRNEMQKVDKAKNIPKLTKEIEEAGCPFCLGDYDEKHPPEYNHSHFVDDNLNLEHNKYICKSCNVKATIRNKGLTFYAHNANKYDLNLFIPQMLNDPDINNHSFLNKSESRFTEVKLGFGFKDKLGNSIYKMTFRDSRLLVDGALSKVVGAWVGIEDRKIIKDFLKLYYKIDKDTEALEDLVTLSFAKQVFPYEALNNDELLESKEPIPVDYFHNTFVDESCTEEDYKLYLNANEALKKVVGKDYNFSNYHDYYLLLDVVLLGIVLFNFMNVNYDLNGVNPLFFLSTASYSFNALLKNNLYSENKIPDIIIPNVEVQQFVKRSIRGGFTMNFNSTNLKGPDDLTLGSDFTSLYPSVASMKKLPYEFKEFLNIENKTTEEIIKEISEMSDDLYCFVEVDIAALKPEFQDKAAVYPMYPQRHMITASEYSHEQHIRYKLNNNTTNPMPDQELNTVSFYEKKNYVASWSYIKQSLEVGYEVTKVHRCAVFHADYVLKEYIDHVYKLKEDATEVKNNLEAIIEEFNKNKKEGDKLDQKIQEAYNTIKAKIVVYKLILNAIYGFCIVNSDKFKQADLLDIEDQKELILRRISNPRFISMLQVGEKVVVSQQKTSYTMDYPLMLGSAILFESKLFTSKYIFALYDYLKEKNLTLHPCFYDTDSCYISIGGFKKEFKSIPDFCSRFNKEVYKLFDTSGFDKALQDPTTHNQLGFMTLEAKGKPILDYAGIAAKCYSYKSEEETCTKGKGISERLQHKYLNFDLYKTVVDGSILEDYNPEKYSCNFKEFRSSNFAINTRDSTKRFITLVDLKSYRPNNSTEYAVFGSEKHKRLLESE